MSWPPYDRECECCGADVVYAYHDGAAVAFGLMGMAEAIEAVRVARERRAG